VFALLPTIPYIAYSDIVDGKTNQDCWYDYKLKETKCVSEDDDSVEEKDKTEDKTVDCTYDRSTRSLVCKNDQDKRVCTYNKEEFRWHCRTFKACTYDQKSKETTCTYEKYTCSSKEGKDFSCVDLDGVKVAQKDLEPGWNRIASVNADEEKED
jgi:hypothetical protein